MYSNVIFGDFNTEFNTPSHEIVKSLLTIPYEISKLNNLYQPKDQSVYLSSLYIACHKCDENMVTLMLKHGANPLNGDIHPIHAFLGN